MYSDNEKASGIKFTTSKSIVIKSLTIVNCAFHPYINEQKVSNSLHFVDINGVTLEWVLVQNGSGYGLFLVNNFDVLIANSSFATNGHRDTFGGNAYIYCGDQLKNLLKFNIWNQIFLVSLGYASFVMYGSKVEVIIENNKFSHNIGGGVYINLSGNGSVEFQNCTVFNNTASNGGGVSIDLHGNSSIEFNKCTISSNTAQDAGGEGVSIDSYQNVSIEFNKCTISNNTAQNEGGGGVLIHFHGTATIAFNVCTISSNTAQEAEGGGVSIDLHGNARIEFCKCTICSNTAQYVGGGGVSINLYGNDSIEFNNCTISKNIGQYRGGGGVSIILNGMVVLTLTSVIYLAILLRISK